MVGVGMEGYCLGMVERVRLGVRVFACRSGGRCVGFRREVRV